MSLLLRKERQEKQNKTKPNSKRMQQRLIHIYFQDNIMHPSMQMFFSQHREEIHSIIIVAIVLKTQRQG